MTTRPSKIDRCEADGVIDVKNSVLNVYIVIKLQSKHKSSVVSLRTVEVQNFACGTGELLVYRWAPPSKSDFQLFVAV